MTARRPPQGPPDPPQPSRRPSGTTGVQGPSQAPPSTPEAATDLGRTVDPSEAPEALRSIRTAGPIDAGDACLRCGTALAPDEPHDLASCDAQRAAAGLAPAHLGATCRRCRLLLVDRNRRGRELHRKSDCDERMRRLDQALDPPARSWSPMTTGF